MADGKVVIDVILDDGSVAKGIANVDRSIGGMGDTAKSSAISIGKIASALGLVYVAKKGIDLVKNSIDGAITRFDTLNQFPRVMQMIGFDAQDSEVAINKLSDGIQGLPTRLDAVASTAQNIAVMTGDLDGAVDTTLALNNAFLASGASTADAERGLQQYVQMLSKGEVDLMSWRTLQETMGVALNQLAEDFGFTGESAQNDLYDALKSGEITFDEFNEKLIEASEAQGGFAEMALTASEGIRTSYENIKTAFVVGVTGILEEIDKLLGGTGDVEDGLVGIVGVLEGFKDGVYSVFGAMSSAIPGIAEAIMNVYEALQPWMPLIKSIVAGIGTFIVAFAGIGTVIGIINKIRNAFLLLNAVLLANPIGLVIGLIAGLVAAGVTLYQNWDKVKNKALDVFPGIESIVGSVAGFFQNMKSKVSGVIDNFTPLLDGFKDSIGNSLESVGPIIDNFKNIWDGLKPVLTAVATLVGGAFVTSFGIAAGVINGVINAIGPFVGMITAAIGVITNLAGAVISLFQGDFVGAFDHFKNALQGVWDFLSGLVMTIYNLISGLVTGIIDFFHGLYMTLVGNSIIPDMVEAIVEWFSNMWDWLVEIVSGIVESVVDFFTNLYETAVEIFTAFWEFITDIWEYISETFSNALDFILALVTLDFEGMKEAMENQMENARELLSEIWDKIKSLIGEKAAEILENIVKRFIEIKDNIKEKITAAKDALVNRFTEMVTNAKNKVQEILKNVISKFIEIKNNITNKITEAKTALVNKFTEMVTSAKNKAQEIVTAAKDKFEAVKQGIKDKLSEAVTVVGEKIGEMPGKVMEFFGDMVDVGKNLIAGLINGIKQMGSDAIEAVTGVVDGVIDKAKNLLDFGSPSKLFHQFGEWTSEGLANGIEKMRGLAEKASEALAGGVEGAFNPELSVGDLSGIPQLKGITPEMALGTSRMSVAGGGSQVVDAIRNIKLPGDLNNKESRIPKQPAVINVHVGSKKVATEIVDDITNLQNRESNRKRKIPRPRGAF